MNRRGAGREVPTMRASIFMILALLGAAPAAAENHVEPIIQPAAAAPAPHRAIHHRTAVARAEAPALATLSPIRSTTMKETG